MMKASFAAIASVALLATGAAAQDEPSSDERLADLKQRHAEMLMWHLTLPATAKRTTEYRALRDEWVALRDQLRKFERERQPEQLNEDWEWTPPE